MTPEYFGLCAWGPAVDEPDAMVPVPVGMVCLDCDEPIGPHDAGVIAWHVTVEAAYQHATRRARHRECFLRSILGSVAHQARRCSCYGGTEEDPPGMTKREAARAACIAAGVPLSLRASG